jgi:Methylamine utilisation protein MauE
MTAVHLDPALRLLLRLSVSLLFLSAARHKLRDPTAFRAALHDYRLLPAMSLAPASVAIIALELFAGTGLWLPGISVAAVVTGAALLSVYGAAMSINLVRGRRHIDCGCAGPAARRPISAALVARNAILAVLALAAALPGAARALSWVDALTVIGGAAVAALLYAGIDGLLARGPALRVLAEHLHPAEPL